MTVLSYAHWKDTGDNEVMDWVFPNWKLPTKSPATSNSLMITLYGL